MTKNHIIFFITGFIFFTSCKRDDEFNIDNNTSTARDHVLAQTLFTELQTLIYQAEQGNFDNFREVNDTIISGCATVIRDTVSSVKTISIDYGSVNCLCSDGRYRRGIISASYTGNFNDSGTVVTISTTNYFNNDNKVIATKKITYRGKNSNNHSYYSNLDSGSVEKAGNMGIINWNANQTRIWTQGEATSGTNWQDDIYQITGIAHGRSGNGATFSSNILDPLQIDLNCWQINTGRIEFTPSNTPIRYINLGSGACDSKATITINGNVFEISLY